MNITPLMASAQQCVDLFTKSVAPDGNSSIPDVRNNDDFLNAAKQLSPEAQFKLMVQVFDSIPSMRPFAARQMLRVAEANLKDHHVAYTKTITDKGGVLIITPSTATPLNKFAKDIFDHYGAVLQINPYLILASHENGVFTSYRPLKDGDQAPVPSLHLSWKHIADIDHLLFAKDPEFLNELRHIQTFYDLGLRKASPFYGQIFIKGKIPGDPNPDIKDYGRYFYFDKIKIFHTSIKEELNALRNMVNKSEGPERLEEQRKKIIVLINSLNIIASRSGLAANEYLKPGNVLISGSTDIADYHVYATIKYDDNQGNHFTIKMPLVHSPGLYSPRNGQYVDRQMKWLFETTRVALQQSAQALKLFESFDGTLSVKEINALIDAVQRVLSAAKLAPPEPA